MRSDARAVKQSDYMGFQKAPEKRNATCLAFVSLQTRSRCCLLQFLFNSTLIQLKIMWRTLGSRRSLYDVEIATVKSLEMYKNKAQSLLNIAHFKTDVQLLQKQLFTKIGSVTAKCLKVQGHLSYHYSLENIRPPKEGKKKQTLRVIILK